MAAFLWTVFVLLLIGIVYFGYAKAVLLILLIGSGLFFGSAAAWGIYEAIIKRKPKPDNPSGAMNAQEAREGLVLLQARSLRTIPCTATDEELAQLRKLAGLH